MHIVVHWSKVFFLHHRPLPNTEWAVTTSLSSLVHELCKGLQTALGHGQYKRWGKCWFTGVTIWHCRQSYKQRLASPVVCSQIWPCWGHLPGQSRFIVNYGWFWGRQSQVHSYINPVLFMGSCKTPRTFFFLPHETSFEVLVRCCHFFKNWFSCRFLESWVICSKSSFFKLQDICYD